MRKTLAALSLLAATLPAPEASAFCGFYVSGADAKLFNNATQVVLMREGIRTVLSMANNYQGPPENFAMVVPVPVVLQKENVKTLPRELFERVDKLGAPRLVEYWEQDPCKEEGIGLGSIGTIGRGAGMGYGSGLGAAKAPEVEVLAQFAVGEYEIVILGASDSMALEQWLKGNGYKIPAGAEPHLRPYVASGSKFFVARVDASKVSFKNGQAQLSPLRFHYDSELFSLPIRLGMINAGESQDLIVNIIARNQRYEAANYPNATIPTNLDVNESTLGDFGAFYAALFDRTLDEHPRSVVTEYAWDSGSCDPCPEPALDGRELVTLGADVLPIPPIRGGGNRGRSAMVPQLRVGKSEVTGKLPPEVINRILRQNFGRFRLCYESALNQNPALQGTLELAFSIDPSGAIQNVKSGPQTTLQDPTMVSCAVGALANTSFPSPEGGSVKVSYAIQFSPPAGAWPAASSPASSSSAAPAPPPPPAIVNNPGGFVLTRLHARYRKDGLADDLVFRPAPPIVGGREIRDGKAIEAGVRPDTTNNFQGRYAVRHGWKGEIKCATPARGRWGGPPDGEPRKARAATDLAFASRGAPLSRFMAGPIPPGAVSVSLPSPAPSASAPAASAPATSAASAPLQGRCGCRAPGEQAAPGAWPSLLLGLGALLGARRGRR